MPSPSTDTQRRPAVTPLPYEEDLYKMPPRSKTKTQQVKDLSEKRNAKEFSVDNL